eukprot:TRINITY_DN48396_c0_g1_i1.p1 TRINITY_DN48396_c0_g1~~TRINITY_DN48396_c0_g1_i1.p1  ORF type:complete len:989 (+),score=180.10 TRINITY_DN48396_c0_g1_i1:85-3051(+)
MDGENADQVSPVAGDVDDEPLLKRARLDEEADVPPQNTGDANVSAEAQPSMAADVATAAGVPAPSTPVSPADEAVSASKAVEMPASEAPTDSQQPVVTEASVAAPLTPESPAKPAESDVDEDDDWGVDWDVKRALPNATVEAEEIIATYGKSWPGVNEGLETVREKEKATFARTYEARTQDVDMEAGKTDDFDADAGGAGESVLDLLDDEDAEWGNYGWGKDPRFRAEADDIDYQNTDILPDATWSSWTSNSSEGLVTTLIIQKIRGRTILCKSWKERGDFPGEAEPVFKNIMTTQKEDQQYMLIATLLWVEAVVLEGKGVPPDLGAAAIQIFRGETEALSAVCRRVPRARLLHRAGCARPSLKVRKAADEEVVPRLIDKLHASVKSDSMERDDIVELVEDSLGDAPATVRIVALAHAHEYAHLKSGQYRTKDALAVAFAKQCMMEHAMETVCRLNLADANELAMSLCSEEVEELRKAKIRTLNRLYLGWKLNPTEDQMCQIHTVPMLKQLQVLLNVERDVELFWVNLEKRRVEKKDRAGELRAFIDFDKLVKPHLFDKKTAGKEPLEAESGIMIKTSELAMVRHHVQSVLKITKMHYNWSPALRTKMLLSRVNWVARLSALLHLMARPQCLNADEELKVLLKQEANRKIGAEVLVRFEHWHKLEEGGFTTNIRAPTTLSKHEAEARNSLYDNYMPDKSKKLGPSGFQPMTPAGVGFHAPGTPGFAVASFGSKTPRGAPPGTPAGPPPATPAFTMRAAGTPAGPPPATPFRPAAGTPAGFPPSTPCGPGPATPSPSFWRTNAPMTPGVPPPAAGTPGGMSSCGMPMTPAGAMTPERRAGGAAPFTPVGPAFSAGAAPFTPAGPAAIPSTPVQRIPTTPGGAAPSTPGIGMRSVGGMIPRTPVSAAMSSAFSGATPSTPVGFGLSGGGGGSSVGKMIPRTPVGPMLLPGTPCAAPANKVASAVPQTPCGAAPQTPGIGFITSTAVPAAV